MVSKQIIIDVWKKFREPITIVQYEDTGRELIVYLTSGSQPVDVSSATVVFYAIKPDGNVIYNNFDIIDGAAGKVSYEITGQTCVLSGDLRCWIDIATEESKLRTQEFSITVQASVDSSGAIESTSEYTALDAALAAIAGMTPNYSLEQDANGLHLKNDEATPDDGKFYGVRGGAKGFFPAAMTGEVKDWPYNRLPANGQWLWCSSEYDRDDYPDLFNWLCYDVGEATISIASPGVVTLASHGFVDGDQIYLTTSGVLPTGLSAETLYYVKYIDADTFNLSATRGGAAINTSGTQSGTHHLRDCPHGNGDGSTTFNTPDRNGLMPIGRDVSDPDFKNIGKTGGDKTHELTIPDMPGHDHSGDTAQVAGYKLTTSIRHEGTGASYVSVDGTDTGQTSHVTAQGNGTPFSIVNPHAVTNYIIKT